MRFTHLTSVLVIAAISVNILFAQQLFFQHYSGKDGLKARMITSLEWSENGLFVGTDAGIFIKDGADKFKKLKSSI